MPSLQRPHILPIRIYSLLRLSKHVHLETVSRITHVFWPFSTEHISDCAVFDILVNSMSASTTTTSSSPHKMLGSMIKNAFRVIYYINTGCMPSGRKGECITIDDFAYSLMWPIIPVFGALLCIVLAFLLVTFGFYWLSCRASRRDMLNWRWTRTLVKTSTKALVLTYGLLFPYCTHMSYVIGRVPKTPGKDDRALSLLLITARVQVAWCTFAM